MIKTSIKLSVLSLCLALLWLAQPALAQRSGWTNYEYSGQPLADGEGFSLQIPPGYKASPATLPMVAAEFNKDNSRGETISGSYVTIAFINIPGFDRLYKDPETGWSRGFLDEFWEMVAQQLNGARSYRTLFYAGNPAMDVKIKQSQAYPYVVYREMDVRLLIYGDVTIKLECGEFATDERSLNQAQNSGVICEPFFNSLTFK
jgi:hypothetical protein